MRLVLFKRLVIRQLFGTKLKKPIEKAKSIMMTETMAELKNNLSERAWLLNEQNYPRD